MPKEIDPVISEHMRNLARKRKNPYLGFKDKKKATKAARLGGLETQRRRREAKSG